MDSLTQIVLGAACGEAVLGKKIGNRALLFGAIGGTIPDLDVIVGNLLFANQISAMLFHRGIMHSLLFSFVACFILGWLVFKTYNFGKRFETTTLKDWMLLFFWSLVTHPILDCFTPYGTQLFAPFSNYRVAFNNIAVADPLYTIPFLVCMIVLMFYKRTSVKRRKWLHYGLTVSSVYMVFTLGNKLYIDQLFKNTLADKNITVNRFSSQPTILNNVLWYGVAETDTNYYVGYYSWFDTSNRFTNWHELPKLRIDAIKEDENFKGLTWFSNDYFNVKEIETNTYEYADLRYPFLNPDDVNSVLFKLELFEANGILDMKPFEPKTDGFSESFQFLWERIKGN